MRTRSCRPLGQGREDMREWLKHHATAVVRVVTDDAVIDLGYLVRETRYEIRVGTCQQERMFDRFQFGHRQKWVVLAIPRNRIREYAVRG